MITIQQPCSLKHPLLILFFVFIVLYISFLLPSLPILSWLYSAYLSSGCWVDSPDTSGLPCTSATTDGASPGVELPAVGCSELPVAGVSPTASSNVQEARLLVSMGEPSS